MPALDYLTPLPRWRCDCRLIIGPNRDIARDILLLGHCAWPLPTHPLCAWSSAGQRGRLDEGCLGLREVAGRLRWLHIPKGSSGVEGAGIT
jgi:hypothetical protein